MAARGRGSGAHAGGFCTIADVSRWHIAADVLGGGNYGMEENPEGSVFKRPVCERRQYVLVANRARSRRPNFLCVRLAKVSRSYLVEWAPESITRRIVDVYLPDGEFVSLNLNRSLR